MKKRIFKCMAILALVSVGFASCSKEDPAEKVDFKSYSLEQGTIKGIAKCFSDERLAFNSPDVPQYAPSGTVLFLTVTYGALGIENATHGETVKLQATVGANGEFTFSDIPLNRYKATSVTITAQPFVKGYTAEDGGDWVDGVFVRKYTTKNYVFTAPQKSTSLLSSEIVVITYSKGDLYQ